MQIATSIVNSLTEPRSRLTLARHRVTELLGFIMLSYLYLVLNFS